jgi:hypothetical protein
MDASYLPYQRAGVNEIVTVSRSFYGNLGRFVQILP